MLFAELPRLLRTGGAALLCLASVFACGRSRETDRTSSSHGDPHVDGGTGEGDASVTDGPSDVPGLSDSGDNGSSPDSGNSDEEPELATDGEASPTDSSEDEGTEARTDVANPAEDLTDGGESSPPGVPADSDFLWENPLPQGNSLLTAWASSDSDIWVGGRFGTLLHFDGDAWQTSEPPNAGDVLGLWGSGAQDVWAASSAGVWHFDGAAWSLAFGETRRTTAVWGSAGNDVWVGTNGAVIHFDGQDWMEHELPGGGSITSIWGSGADDVWATRAGGERDVWGVLHYDGNGWDEASVEPDVAAALAAPSGVEVFVSGSAAGDVWVLRQEQEGFSEELIAWHYDGEIWSATPLGGGSAQQLLVSDGGDVWILEQEGQLRRKAMADSTFDDALVPLPFANALALASLPGGDGEASESILAVGRAGLVSTWTGAASGWSELSRGSRADIDALWSLEGQVWATGTGYADAQGNPDRMVGPLSLISGTVSEALPVAVVDMWGTAPDDLWAVGRQTVHHFDGVAWSTVDDSGADHQAIWGSASDDIWVVGDRALWRGGADTTWDKQSENYADVHGSSASDVWLVIGETVCHFNGREFINYELAGLNLLSVAATGERTFAVGLGGAAVYSSELDEWTLTLLDANLFAVHATGDAQAWAVGSSTGDPSRAVVFQFNDAEWQPVPIFVDTPLRTVTSDGQRLWISGDDGVLLSRAL